MIISNISFKITKVKRACKNINHSYNKVYPFLLRLLKLRKYGNLSKNKCPYNNGDKNLANIGIVSLGCAKALTDSERILTRLRAEGYNLVDSYDEADAVIVNTCGFLDSAKAESFEAIHEALSENGKVLVTGCLGALEDEVLSRFPKVLSVTGPQQYKAVMDAVHDILPPEQDPKLSLLPPEGLRLTPHHYAYLKISEGCNHQCSFCIIPQLRGRQVSRSFDDIFYEAEALAISGTKELLVIGQDTGDWGSDLSHKFFTHNHQEYKANIVNLCRRLGELKLWVRLHYMYPWKNVDELIPLMADGLIAPYLDIPFQHASPKILRSMKRPAQQEKLLERIANWRSICPEIALRSTFIVGYPDESDQDFDYLMDWLKEAQLDHVGVFQFEAVDGAAASEFEQVADEVKQWRFEQIMELQSQISKEKLRTKVNKSFDVVIDSIEDDMAVGRTIYQAPEVDGVVYIKNANFLKEGERVQAKIISHDSFDLFAELA